MKEAPGLQALFMLQNCCQRAEIIRDCFMFLITFLPLCQWCQQCQVDILDLFHDDFFNHVQERSITSLWWIQTFWMVWTNWRLSRMESRSEIMSIFTETLLSMFTFIGGFPKESLILSIISYLQERRLEVDCWKS